MAVAKTYEVMFGKFNIESVVKYYVLKNKK